MNDLKQKIAAKAWLFAILAGAILFLIANKATDSAGLGWLPSLLVSVGAFVLGALGVWIIMRNLVDTYTLDAVDEAQSVERLLNQIRSKLGQIRDKSMQTILANICQHATDLVLYTKRKQPDNLLSCCTVLEKWLEMIVDTTLRQVLDIQAQPAYYRNAQASLDKASKGFDGFDKFLLNSIQTIADGSNMQFESAAKMLDATRYNVV